MATPSTPRVRLAVLDESTAARLRADQDHSGDIEVVWSGTDAEQMLADAPSVDVLLLALDHLGSDPVATVDALVERTGAELAITLYAFAKRELLAKLNGARVRALRSPLDLHALRVQMMSVIARNILSSSGPSTKVEAPRYSASQLGRLQQISTAIECECPNHLATLLQNLTDFESYSENCESRNTADAAIHRMLYESTARARSILERALDRLIVHEKIEL